MEIEGLIALFQSAEFQSLAAVFSTIQFAGSALSKIKHLKKKYQKDSHEWQLINCLEQALLETQNSLEWENDSDAIAETFFGSLFTFKDMFSEDVLTGIFKNAVGHDVTQNDIGEWIHQLLIQLSRKEHTELREYLKMRHILPSSDAQQTVSVGRIITPQAPRWRKDEIICRDELVDLLCEEISNGVVHLQLTGMGGIGKTEILNKVYVYFINTGMHFFDHIGLLFYSGSIEKDVEQQVDYPKQYKGLEGAMAAERFLQDLCNEKKVLLLVDDIREKQVLPSKNDAMLQYLKTLNASILFASRIVIDQFHNRPVSVLSTDACISIFEKQFGMEIKSDKERAILFDIIKKKAGNNTLIVNRLGIMARDYCWSIAEVFTQLENNKFNIPKASNDDELLQQEIDKLYNIGDNFSEIEKNILEAFSLFPSIPLSRDICIEWLFEDATIDPTRCGLLLSRLAELTWLDKRCSLDDKKPYYLMHQMVTTAVQAQLKVAFNNHKALVNNCANSILQNTIDFNFKKASQFIPYALFIFASFNCQAQGIATLASSIGKYNYHTANYVDSLEWYQKALEINKKTLGNEHVDTATIIDNIAAVYDNQGDYAKALGYSIKALNIRKKILGTEHPQTATSYNNIAMEYNHQGYFKLSFGYHQKALEIREKILGTEHLETATSYNNIAEFYDGQGDYSIALEWCMKALDIREKVLGTMHPRTADTYNNIATEYYRLGAYSEALEWCMKALDIREKVLGMEHPDTATTYNIIALVYSCQRDYSEALKWHMKDLQICEKVLGTEHLDTATSYNNIAGIYYRKKDYVKALEWYMKDLKIREKKLGAEHPDIATTYNNIARAYDRQGNYEKSLEWYMKDLKISEKELGTEHPYTATTYNNIAEVYECQGECIKALELYQKSLRIFKAKLGLNHQNTKIVHDNISRLLDKLKK